jgi:hypothetical protein
MAQATLPFEAPATGPQTVAVSAAGRQAHQPGNDPTGFDVGWDFAHHLLTPPAAHLHDASPVHQGWRAGRAAFGFSTLRATAQVRLWLQLRLSAWVHGQVFEGVQVTPRFLREIEATQCPITREPLTRATGTGSDAMVARVNHGAAHAAGNLATISARAEHAKASIGWQEALDRSRQIEAAESGQAHRIDGLDAKQWARLGVLMSLVTPLPHATAATLPLRVLPPNRLRVLNPVQALQVMLTLQFTQASCARSLVALAALMPTSEVRQAFQVFMHTLLARRLDAGQTLDGTAMRETMEDTWADPLVNRRWQRLALRLTEQQCEQLLQLAAQKGLAGRGTRWLSLESATEAWALESGGYVQLPPAEASPLDATVPTPMPGKLRSLGSQKLASCDALTACGAFQ